MYLEPDYIFCQRQDLGFTQQRRILSYLYVTMIHKDSLEVDKAGLLEDLLAQDPHVVVRHPQDLYLMVQMGGHGGESGSCTIGFPFSVGPFAVAIFGTMV